MLCEERSRYAHRTQQPGELSTYPHFFEGRWRADDCFVSVCGMNDYIHDEPPPVSLFQSLAERRDDMLERCRQVTLTCGRQLVFGMATALVLQEVPLPDRCNIDTSLLHLAFRTSRERIRTRALPVESHVWPLYRDQAVVNCGHGVTALHPFHAWAQMAAHLQLREIVILGDSMLASLSRRYRYVEFTPMQHLENFIDRVGSFKRKSACRMAIPLMRLNVMSPKESELRLGVEQHGLPPAVTNYVVTEVSFDSGADVTLDIAWVEFRVGVEYDGDHHRTDRQQWRRDNEKREKLRDRKWIVVIATAQDLRDDMAIAQLSLRLARHLAERGAKFDFQVIAMTLEQLAARKGYRRKR